MTARKPDSMLGRPRGNSVRVSIGSVSASNSIRESGRIVDTPRSKRTVESTKDVEVETVRGKAAETGVVDSIAARLDQWETQDAQHRLDQATEGI